MSFTVVHEHQLRAALGHVLQHIVPPPSHTQPSNPPPTPSDDAVPPPVTFAPISIRWPPIPPPPTLPSLLDALTCHDLLLAAAHAVVLQHGAHLASPDQSDQRAAAQGEALATASVSGAPPLTSSTPSTYSYLPHGWNGSRLLYSLRYTFITPIETPPPTDADNTSQAEVLTAASPIAYVLHLKAVPMASYLVLTSQLHHVSPVDGAHNPVSPAYKLTLRCDDYLDLAHVLKYVSTPHSTPLPPSVYLNLDWLTSGVSNGLIKRCMGPLWTLFYAPNTQAANFMSPYLPDLPVDLVTSILVFLGSKDLARLSGVSAVLQALTSLPFLWQLLCEREYPLLERRAVEKEDWRAELIVRKRMKEEEAQRNRFALVPVGMPVEVGGRGWEEMRGERPWFPFAPLGRDINDPLGLGDWRRAGGGGRWRQPGGFRVFH